MDSETEKQKEDPFEPIRKSTQEAREIVTRVFKIEQENLHFERARVKDEVISVIKDIVR